MLIAAGSRCCGAVSRASAHISSRYAIIGPGTAAQYLDIRHTDFLSQIGGTIERNVQSIDRITCVISRHNPLGTIALKFFFIALRERSAERLIWRSGVSR